MKWYNIGMIGLAIITHKRPEYFQKCFKSVIDNKRDIDYLCVILSGDNKDYQIPEDIDVIRNTDRTWVSVNKNIALKQLIDKGCDHLFLIEDDIIIKSEDVFNRYIQAGKKAGIQHFNFALHGPANESGYKYTDNNVDYYPHCVGAFSYYTKEVIEKVGYMDENLKNAWEHCEHTQRIGDEGYTSPFWAFADVHGSGELLTEIPNSIDNSSIRPNKDWKKNIDDGLAYWRGKNPNCPL